MLFLLLYLHQWSWHWYNHFLDNHPTPLIAPSCGHLQISQRATQLWRLAWRETLSKSLMPDKYTLFQIVTNYLPKWRWIVVDIHRATKRGGKYPPLSLNTEVNNCFIIYHTDTKNSVYLSHYTEKSLEIKLLLGLITCWEVSSTCYSLPN